MDAARAACILSASCGGSVVTNMTAKRGEHLGIADRSPGETYLFFFPSLGSAVRFTQNGVGSSACKTSLSSKHLQKSKIFIRACILAVTILGCRPCWVSKLLATTASHFSMCC